MNKLLILITAFLGFIALSVGILGGWTLATNYLSERGNCNSSLIKKDQ